MAGKGKKGGRGGTKYVHNHTYNPTARESDERKIERLHNMEVKRYQNCVDRNMKVVTEYLPVETIAYKKQKIGMLISVSWNSGKQMSISLPITSNITLPTNPIYLYF